jgi:hypothetical protein
MIEYADSKLDDRICRFIADIQLVSHIRDIISSVLITCAQLPSDMSNLAQYTVNVMYARALSNKLLGFYVTIAVFDFCKKHSMQFLYLGVILKV